MRILIAEDERITRLSLQIQLESWEHDVVAVQDGAAAWEQFQRQQFDIVVTDWDMPRMDGTELIKRIRDNDQHAYAYLIMLTGRSETADLVAGMEAGADDFLAKPFDRNELRVRVNAGERIIRLERKLAAQNDALQAANGRMKRDLEAAAAMQRDLLPKALPGALGAAFAWHFEPCDELGGDILNVLPLSNHNVAMYLLDVTGHGVPAALLSVTLSKVLTARDPQSSLLIARDSDVDAPAVRPPSEVAQQLNRLFPMEAQGGRFFTMVYAVLDTATGILRYANAGHPPPILLGGDGVPRQLSCGSLPIGVAEDDPYEDFSVQMSPGDRLYFYSDGITEATNDRGEMLQPEGFLRLIERTPGGSLHQDLASCIGKLKHWCNPVPFADDISLLVLEM